MGNLHECHVTFDGDADSALILKAGRDYRFHYSEINGDEVLGKGVKKYLTRTIEDFNELDQAMRTRAAIRRSIPRGEPDRIADQLEQAATRLSELSAECERLREDAGLFRFVLSGDTYAIIERDKPSLMLTGTVWRDVIAAKLAELSGREK